MFQRDSHSCKWLVCKTVKKPYILYFYSVPYRCKIEPPDSLQLNGLGNSENEMCIGNKFFCYVLLETAFVEDEKSTTSKSGHQTVLSDEIIR